MEQTKVNIQELTLRAEAGDSRFVTTALESVGNIEERTKVLREVDAFNERRRAAEIASGKSTVPDLDLEIGAYSENVIRSSLTLKSGVAGNRTPLYNDMFDLRTPSQRAGSEDWRTKVNLEELTNKAEKGDGNFVRTALDNAGGLQERMTILREVDALNQKRRADEARSGKSTLPDLEIEIGTYSQNEIKSSLGLKSGDAGNRRNLYSEMFNLQDLSRRINSSSLLAQTGTY